MPKIAASIHITIDDVGTIATSIDGSQMLVAGLIRWLDTYDRMLVTRQIDMEQVQNTVATDGCVTARYREADSASN